ncbi:uncharacterized protein LOC133746763 isoform X3 [Lepus europaeus]|uniref:uncharacterized protein LOC133746763 isoform X3 n=1 Tax=Lepus europaeus TaxID=9983 RepID=UPI002B463C80|nr:uncharacterized protein LOC133746763 isoform X3 [Lepus europaeus]
MQLGHDTPLQDPRCPRAQRMTRAPQERTRVHIPPALSRILSTLEGGTEKSSHRAGAKVCHIRTSPVPPPISAAPRTGPRAGCSASGSKVPAAPQLKPTAAGVSKGQAKGPEVPGRKCGRGLCWGGGRLQPSCLLLPGCAARCAPCTASQLSPRPSLLLPPVPHLTSAPAALLLWDSASTSKRSASFLANGCFPGNPALRLQGRSSHCDAAAGVDLRADAWWRERLCTAVLSARGWQSRWGQGCCHTSQCPDPFPPTHQVLSAESSLSPPGLHRLWPACCLFRLLRVHPRSLVLQFILQVQPYLDSRTRHGDNKKSKL